MDISITKDFLNRPVIVVGDDAAVDLLDWKRAGWAEVHGMGYGESARAAADSERGQQLAAIFEAAEAAGEPDAFVAGSVDETGKMVLHVCSSGISRSYADGAYYIAG